MPTRRQFSEAKVFHGSSGNEWFLWIVEDMRQCIHSYVKVGDVHSHSLFTHCRLVSVSRRLEKKYNISCMETEGRLKIEPKRVRGSTSLSGMDCVPGYDQEMV